MDMISIMIVDNDLLRMEKLVAALCTHADLKTISAVSKRETAFKQLSLAPDVMLLNPVVLKPNTLSRFLRSVQMRSRNTKVVLLLPARLDDASLIDCIRFGVRGYVTVGDTPAILAKAVHAVMAGEIWAERRVLQMTISQHMLLPQKLETHAPNLEPLTCREMDMLNQVMKGATNREIAEKYCISERTVKTHLYRVYRKLNVKSRTKAIALLSH